jgi:hypothetical protein
MAKNKFEPVFSRVDVHKLISNIVLIFTEQARIKRNKIEVLLDKRVPKMLLLDSERF